MKIKIAIRGLRYKLNSILLFGTDPEFSVVTL